MTRHRTAPDGRPAGPTSYVATAVTDEQCVVTVWSEGARRLLGYRPEEVVGRPAADLLAEDEPGAAPRSWGGRHTWSGRVALRHRDGHRVETELLAHRRGPECFLVSAVSGEPRPEDGGALARWGFDRAPCILAIYDTRLRNVGANADMERAVALTEDQMHGMRLPEILPHPESEKTERAMRQVVDSGERRHLENFLRVPGEGREHVWSVSLAPMRDPNGRVGGVCFAAHGITDHYEARRRLLFITEASERIGTTLDITRTAQELADMAVPRLADLTSVDLLTFLHHGDEPPPGPPTGPITLCRTAVRSVLEGAPDALVDVGDIATYPESSPPAESLAAGRPASYQVTDPFMARWMLQDPERAERIHDFGTHSVMVVPMRARGVTLGLASFTRHRRPDPFTRDDLLLAEELTARGAVCIDNARRYTREHTTAVTLQRRLLPHKAPEQSALEVASRYRPAGALADVGGDWFDVIPLSGARVALVVGDVVGHGLQASATMGGLRTAVRTLADIDLPPDELLTHLDDLVVRLSGEDDVGSSGDVGATCLYAVYDPITRRCTVARAGNPAPVVAGPQDSPATLDVPSGPPLGLGRLPFEAVEVELAEGSLLALYTDGLIEANGRDADEGIEALRAALDQPAPSLESACDTVLAALLPDRPDDDIALLLARTRVLGTDQVATWEVPFDPSAVARMRQNASEQLVAWGLQDAVVTTELVVSELVTNAIRYGQPPVQLRLIHDRTLICEVSDGSNTAPHLRRARILDEGGRGLLLVAQLSRRWGTRHGSRGKTIWAEQDLTAG